VEAGTCWPYCKEWLRNICLGVIKVNPEDDTLWTELAYIFPNAMESMLDCILPEAQNDCMAIFCFTVVFV